MRNTTCVARESQLDKNWGRSFESARYNQILNPEAGKNLEPVGASRARLLNEAMVDHISGEATKQKSSSGIGVGISRDRKNVQVQNESGIT